METSAKDGGGSFGDLRKRHLPLFDESVHRHDRGWPHDEPERTGEAGTARKHWKTIGIFHFRHDEQDEG